MNVIFAFLSSSFFLSSPLSHHFLSNKQKNEPHYTKSMAATHEKKRDKVFQNETKEKMKNFFLSFLSKLDLDVDAGGQVQEHQFVHRFRRGGLDVDQPGVRAGLELFAGVLVDVRGAEEGVDAAAAFF